MSQVFRKLETEESLAPTLAAVRRTPAMIINRTPKETEITIPGNIFVACPAKAFKQRAATKCDGCEHFKGLHDCQPTNSAAHFEDRYTVLCVHPISRQLHRIEIAQD